MTRLSVILTPDRSATGFPVNGARRQVPLVRLSRSRTGATSLQSKRTTADPYPQTLTDTEKHEPSCKGTAKRVYELESG